MDISLFFDWSTYVKYLYDVRNLNYLKKKIDVHRNYDKILRYLYSKEFG